MRRSHIWVSRCCVLMEFFGAGRRRNRSLLEFEVLRDGVTRQCARSERVIRMRQAILQPLVSLLELCAGYFILLKDLMPFPCQVMRIIPIPLLAKLAVIKLASSSSLSIPSSRPTSLYRISSTSTRAPLKPSMPPLTASRSTIRLATRGLPVLQRRMTHNLPLSKA